MPENTTTATDNGETPTSTSTANTTPSLSTPGSPLIFPGDVELAGHFIKFTIVKYSRADRSQGAAQADKIRDIVLPLPSNLTTGYRANYNEGNLDYAGHIALPHMMESGDKLAKSFARLNEHRNEDVRKSVMEEMMQFGRIAADHALGFVGYQALDAFENTELGRAAQLAGGFARNPHLALLFHGIGFRSHQFEYQFVARNQAESNALRDIIKMLRFAMHPSINQSYQNHLFNYPYEFEITMSNESYLFHIGESVLTDFNVNYHATGQPLYFNTESGQKAPVAVTLSLQFTETTIVTQETIERDNR